MEGEDRGRVRRSQRDYGIAFKLARVGTRKLHYLLSDEFNARGIKLGRDGLFAYLGGEGLLIKPKKNLSRPEIG